MKDWRQEDKGTTEDEVVGWNALLTQRTWVWASSRSWWLKGSLVCCSPWGCKVLYTTEWLNWTELDYAVLSCFSRVWLCDLMDCSLPGSSVHWDSPGKNSGVGHHALFQGIFPTQGSNPHLMHCRQILHPLSHQGSPIIIICNIYCIVSIYIQHGKCSICIATSKHHTNLWGSYVN